MHLSICIPHALQICKKTSDIVFEHLQSLEKKVVISSTNRKREDKAE